MFRLLLTAPFLAGSLAVGCASQGAGPEGDAPWVGAAAVPDPDLEALLRPEEPLERTGLYHGKDGRTFYVAELAEEPPRGFLKAYESLLRSRGVLVEATYPSPHDLPPRVESYRFLVFAKGDTPIFSLKYRQFYDGGGDFQSRSRFASVPSPFNLQDRTLALSLGEQPSREWTQTVLVPEEDVVHVKELPFGRYPNSTLIRVHGPDRQERKDLLEDDWVGRVYSARTAIDDVVRWYVAKLSRFGLSVDQRKDSEPVFARSRVPVAGITFVTVDNERCGIGGLGMTVEDVRKRAPLLLEGFPSDATCFRVHVAFVSNAVAADYWTEENQELRRSVSSQEK